MASIRRAPSDPGPVPPAEARITLRQLTEATREDWNGMTAEQRQTWRALTAEVTAAAMGTEFDLRVLLRLEGAAQAAWRARRDAWLYGWLANDPRVSHD